MNSSAIERSIRTAAASLEMEGFEVEPDYIALCRKMLAGEITMEEYLARVTPADELLEPTQGMGMDLTF